MAVDSGKKQTQKDGAKPGTGKTYEERKKDPGFENRFFKGDVGTAVKSEGGVSYGTGGGQVTQEQAKAITEQQRYEAYVAGGRQGVYVPLEGYTVYDPVTGTKVTAESGARSVTVTKTYYEKQQEEQAKQQQDLTIQAAREQYLKPNIPPKDWGAVQETEKATQERKEYERVKKEFLAQNKTYPAPPKGYGSRDVVFNQSPQETNIKEPSTIIIKAEGSKENLIVIEPSAARKSTLPAYQPSYVESVILGGGDFIIEGTASVAKGALKIIYRPNTQGLDPETGKRRKPIIDLGQSEFLESDNLLMDKDVQTLGIVIAASVAPAFITVPAMAGYASYETTTGIIEGQPERVGAGIVMAAFAFSPLVEKGLSKKVEVTRPTGKARQVVEVGFQPSKRGGVSDVTFESKLFIEVTKETGLYKTVPQVSKQPLNYVYRARGQSVKTLPGGGSENIAYGGGGKAKINPKTGEVSILSENIKAKVESATTKNIVKNYDYIKGEKPKAPRVETPVSQVSGYAREVKPKKLFDIRASRSDSGVKIQKKIIEVSKAGRTDQVSGYTRTGKPRVVEEIMVQKKKLNPKVEASPIKQPSVTGIEYQQVKRAYTKKQPKQIKKPKLTKEQKQAKEIQQLIKDSETMPNTPQVIQTVQQEKVVKVNRGKPIKTEILRDPNKDMFAITAGEQRAKEIIRPEVTEVYIPRRVEVPQERNKPLEILEPKTEIYNVKIPIVDTTPRVSQEYRPITDTTNYQIVEPIQVVQPEQKVEPIVDVRPVQQPDQTFVNIFEENTKKGGDGGLFMLPSAKNKAEYGFTPLFVRRRGKFNFIGSFESGEAAYSKGRQIVRETAAASFKVGGRVNKLFDTDIVASTREPQVFIQKREKRISSVGEKLEITQKGIFAQKAKKSLWKVF
jgi:hypothetical protein